MNTESDAEWEISNLRRRLGHKAVDLDIAAALDRWRAEGATGDPAAFLDWVLTTQAEEQVVVTAVLPPRISGAQATVSTDPTLLLAPPPMPLRSTPAPATGPADPVAAPATRYVIVGEAGKGGMAVVHIARDLELIRKVALKRLAGSTALHEEVQARFLREVQISAQLDHPNIVPVYGLEVGPDGVPAYAMKLVEGQTVERFLNDTRAFYERAEEPDDAHALPARLEHFLKACDAMAYAHDKGVVHRDLKPANIMLGRHNEIYVMDWGICRVLRLPDADGESTAWIDEAGDADVDTRTRVGSIVGTARYMAPEQARGQNDRIGPATDQYALGLTLFELVTLQTPYEGRTVVDVLAHAARGEVRPVRHVFAQGQVPRELAAIIGRATATEPAARYHDVRAFADDIRRYLRGDAVDARPDTPWQKAVRNVARHRQAVLTGVVGLVALMAIGTALLLYRHERALVDAAARETEMLALVDHVATRGDVLQTRFLELQSEVDALASATSLALSFTSPTNTPFYWVDDFDVPARHPPDLVDVDGTEFPQSFDYGAWVPAADVDRSQLVSSILRFQHVRPYRNELFQRARALLGTASAAAAGEGGVRDTGIHAFVLGLAEGVTLHLPGHAGLPRVMDPRVEPWYELASGHDQAQWGVPYADPDGDGGLLVSLSQAIRAADGRELGVTGMLLSLDRVIENLVGESPGSGVRATLLLDTEHRVVASSGLFGPLQTAGGDVLLQPFPVPFLIEQLGRQDTGHLITEALGQPDVLAYDTIQPLGWVLVKVTSAVTVDERLRTD